MKGRRVESVKAVWDGEPGDYYPHIIEGTENEVQFLWFKLPTGSVGRIHSAGHRPDSEEGWTITVEPDGSVTVDPSILQGAIPNAKPPIPEWHGHLKAGVWSGG